jgi:hypothetical protein
MARVQATWSPQIVAQQIAPRGIARPDTLQIRLQAWQARQRAVGELVQTLHDVERMGVGLAWTPARLMRAEISP